MRLITWRRSVLSLLLALCLSSGAVGRHRHQDYSSEPGNFDYYLLSLSWSPAYCLGAPTADECTGPRRLGFMVHGLWPQNERGWPRDCGEGERLPESVVEAMADLMPARALVYHEWQTHGTCSGLDPAAYFNLIRRAFHSMHIPEPLAQGTSAGHATPIEQPPQSIVDQFLRANPQWPARSVFSTCGGREMPRLREVRVCLSRDLAPRACSYEAMREACRAPQLVVPPIR